MSGDLAPGKGLRVGLSKEAVIGITRIMADLSDAMAESSSKNTLLLTELTTFKYGWEHIKTDRFGHEAAMRIELPNGDELRVTIVQKGNDIKLDIRHWWQTGDKGE
jgi:hypothetical protein